MVLREPTPRLKTRNEEPVVPFGLSEDPIFAELCASERKKRW